MVVINQFIMKFFIIILCLLLISCNRQVSKSVSGYEDVETVDSSVEKITVENINRYNVLKCSEVFDSISFVRLETCDSSLIGTINKIVATDEYFFILDYSTAKAVFAFDKTGKFLNRIGTKGNGPEEYDCPDDIVYDKYNGELLVWCYNDKKIMRFKPDGTFAGNIKVDWWANAISIVSKDIYLLYLNNIQQKNGKPNDYNMILINRNGEIVNQLLPYDEHKHIKAGFVSDFSFYGDTVLFSPHLGNKIYQLGTDGLQLKYYVDFKEHNIPAFLFVDTDFEKLYEEIKDNSYAHIGYSLETSTHVAVSFRKDRLVYSGFYSKASKSFKWTHGWTNDLYGLVDIGSFQCNKGDLLISSVEPYVFCGLQDVLKKYKTNKSDFTKAIIRQISLENKLSFLDSKLKKRLIENYKSIDITLSDAEIDFVNSIEEGDNPVLVILKLKDF
jgi:hypothetical protein